MTRLLYWWRAVAQGPLRLWESEEERKRLRGRTVAFIKFRHLQRRQRKRVSNKIWHRIIRKRAHIDAIIAAVETTYVRKKIAVPKWLGRRHLRDDIDRALARRKIGSEILGSAWTDRRKRGEKLIKAGQAYVALLTKDKNGDWWTEQLPYVTNEGRRDVPAVVAELRKTEKRIVHLLDTRFVNPESVVLPEGKGAIWPEIAFLDPELESLVKDLMEIFLRWFRMETKVSRRLVDGELRPYGACISFVQAVLDEAGIRGRNGNQISAETVERLRRENMGRRRSKKY